MPIITVALRRRAAELVDNHLAEDAAALHRLLADVGGLDRFASRLNWTIGTPLAIMSFSPFAMDSPGTDVATPWARR